MLDGEQEWTVAGARRLIAETFRTGDIESPELDARLLVGHALGLDHAKLASEPERILSKQEIDAINALAVRRLRHEPVARIIGRKEFWSLPLRVSSTTLVPRPETETIVEAALAAIGDRKRPLRIADLGTGTGAILLALLNELPNATGIGTDIDPLALATAAENARELGLQSRSEFVLSDFGAALTDAFDLVVSNPPYIAESELSGLPPEVRNYDPRHALDGGRDGLDCYRRIAAQGERLMKPGGLIVVEIGAGQSAAVTAIFKGAAFGTVAPPRPDLAGIPRALVFQGFS
jgi:release factor glutamine methyltransferase